MSTRPATWTPSPALLALVKHFEGLHDGDLRTIGLQPKLCPAGVWTEGWGHAIRDAQGRVLRDTVPMTVAIAHAKVRTLEEADALLVQDLQRFADSARRLLTRRLQPHQFDALVSFHYNTGGLRLPNGKHSTLLRMVNEGRFDEAEREFHRWVLAGGKRLRGLVWRRAAEAYMFLGNNWRDALGPERQSLPRA